MRRFVFRPALAPAVLAVAALVLAGCGDDEEPEAEATSASPSVTSESTQPTESATTTAPAPGGVTLTFGLPDFPEALTDGEGTAVYTFSSDQQGESMCDGQCAENWPPVTTTGPPTVEGDPSVAGQVGQQPRADGSMQVTYGGWPLYYFVQDTAPGQANGVGITAFGGQFLLIQRDATQIGG